MPGSIDCPTGKEGGGRKGMIKDKREIKGREEKGRKGKK